MIADSTTSEPGPAAPQTAKPPLDILLCAPRGFCAGVVRAIDVVERALAIHGPPVYVRHEIVHNKYVVESLKRKGAVFVRELEDRGTRLDTLGRLPGARDDLLDREALAELNAEGVVAGQGRHARRDQVTHPGQSGEGHRVATQPDAVVG